MQYGRVRRASEITASYAAAATPRRGTCDEAIPEFAAVLASDQNWIGAISQIGGCKTRLGLLGMRSRCTKKRSASTRSVPASPSHYSRIGPARLLQSRTRGSIVWLEGAPPNPQHPWIGAQLDKTDRAATELAEARRLGGNGLLPSIARARANNSIMDGPAIRDLPKRRISQVCAERGCRRNNRPCRDLPDPLPRRGRGSPVITAPLSRSERPRRSSAPRGLAVTWTVAPSGMLPSRIFCASGFCNSRWITRFKGRAP